MILIRLGLEFPINGFPMAISFLQVSLIWGWMIICKHWISCLSILVLASAPTSQAWTFKLSYAKKPRKQSCMYLPSPQFNNTSPIKSDHKALHGNAQVKTAHRHERKTLADSLVHLIFSYHITEKDITVHPVHSGMLLQEYADSSGYFRLDTAKTCSFLLHKP